VSPSVELGAGDMFFKVKGAKHGDINGEAQDQKHKNEIEVLSWDFGEHKTDSLQASGGAVALTDFNFTMHVNKASPILFMACLHNKRFPKAILTVRKAGGVQQDYLTWTFYDAEVKSYQTGGSGDNKDEVPVEHISLGFSKVEVEYKEQNAEGLLGGAYHGSYSLKHGR